jgi:hypothetical protein
MNFSERLAILEKVEKALTGEPRVIKEVPTTKRAESGGKL